MRGATIPACITSPRSAPLIMQLEDGDRERYVAFDGRGLRRYAGALGRCLRLLGVRRGDTLAYFELGTSPVVYLSSSSYVPYLRRGAAEALGCTTICNDGVATMSERAVEILRYVRPRFFFVGAELLRPFAAACDRGGIDISRYTEALVLTRNGGIARREVTVRSPAALRIPTFRLPRCDQALFFAIECPDCRLEHTWSDLYDLDVVDPDTHRAVSSPGPGLIRVRERFAGVRPGRRVVTTIRGRLAEGRCPRGPRDVRLST